MISRKTSQPLGWLSLYAVSLMLAAPLTAEPPDTVHSQWVYSDHSGKLVYRQLKTGDRIIDFSYAGYGGGGVALPTFPVKKTVAPSGEDDTAAIQSAIDEVSRLPLLHGVRGAVLLAGGHFHCSSTLKLNAEGIVLRGSGSGEADTVIEMTGDPHVAIYRGEQALGKMPTFDPRPELPMLPQGIIDSQDTPVAPTSLYLEQLRERLGTQALKNIGYTEPK